MTAPDEHGGGGGERIASLAHTCRGGTAVVAHTPALVACSSTQPNAQGQTHAKTTVGTAPLPARSLSRSATARTGRIGSSHKHSPGKYSLRACAVARPPCSPLRLPRLSNSIITAALTPRCRGRCVEHGRVHQRQEQPVAAGQRVHGKKHAGGRAAVPCAGTQERHATCTVRQKGWGCGGGGAGRGQEGPGGGSKECHGNN
jgi:hypothetical protein